MVRATKTLMPEISSRAAGAPTSATPLRRLQSQQRARRGSPMLVLGEPLLHGLLLGERAPRSDLAVARRAGRASSSARSAMPIQRMQ